MSYQTIVQDFQSGLALLRDGSDPPRFYVKERGRMELLAIGNEPAARSRFAIRKGRVGRARRRSAADSCAGHALPVEHFSRPVEAFRPSENL